MEQQEITALDNNRKQNVGSNQDATGGSELTGKVKDVNILTLFPEIFRSLDKSVLFTPDKLWRDLGLCHYCPTWQEILSRGRQRTHITTMAGGVEVFTSFFGTTQYINELTWLQVLPFLRYRTTEEQQTVLQFKAYRDQLNPARVWRDATRNTSTQLSSIFAHYDLDPLRTHYNIAPYIVMLGDYNGATAPPTTGWDSVGLSELAQLLAGNTIDMTQYYPILMDEHIPIEDGAIQNVARWVTYNLGLTLLVVYVGTASHAEQLAHQAAGAAGAVNGPMLERIGNLLTDEDNKMILCLQWVVWSRWQGTNQDPMIDMSPARLIPEYSFIDHLVSYLSDAKIQRNLRIIQPFHNMQNVTGDDLCYVMMTVSQLIADRKLDFFHRSRHWPGFNPLEIMLFDPFSRTHNQTYLRNTMDMCFRYHVPAAAIHYITGQPILAPKYVMAETRGDSPDWRRYIQYSRQHKSVCEYKVTSEGQPYFQPLYQDTQHVGSSPWNSNAAAPYNYPVNIVGSRPTQNQYFNGMICLLRSTTGHCLISSMDYLTPLWESSGIPQATLRLQNENFIFAYRYTDLAIDEDNESDIDPTGATYFTGSFSFLGRNGTFPLSQTV